MRYSANGGTPIKVWTGVDGTPYQNLDTFENLFVAPIDANTIGLSTTKVGLGSTGKALEEKSKLSDIFASD